MASIDMARLINLDGLQQVLAELLDASHRQRGELAALRAETDAKFGAIARKVDGVEALLTACSSERELRRAEHEAGAARDGIVRSVEALASRFHAAVETIDARDARRLLLLTEVHNEVKSCAPAAEVQRVKQQLAACASLEQLQATRRALEEQARASSDAWQERAAALAKLSGAHDAALATQALRLSQAAPAEALELVRKEVGAELGALRAEVHARTADAQHGASAAERRLDRRADELQTQAEAQGAALRRLEVEAEGKLGREEAAGQLGALAAEHTAAARGADEDARTAREEVSRRLGELAAAEEAAAARVAAAEDATRGLAPYEELAALEERVLGLAGREELRAELAGLRAEEGERARRMGERLELLSRELAARAGGAQAVRPGGARELDIGSPAGGAALATPVSRALSQPHSSDDRFADSSPQASRLGGELARAAASPSASSPCASPRDDGGDGGGGTGGGGSASGLRADLERRRRQLEERRQSIAAVRQRAAAAGV